MMPDFTTNLYKAVAAVAPINSVAILNPNDRSTWRIDFTEDATIAQKQAARDIVASFDVNAPTPNPQREAIRAAKLRFKNATTAAERNLAIADYFDAKDPD